MSDSMTFAELIQVKFRVLRTGGKKVNQAAVAEEMCDLGFDWTRATVMDIERGKRKIGIAEIFGLAVVFNIPVTNFLCPPADVTVRVGSALLNREEIIRRLGEGADSDSALATALSTRRDELRSELAELERWS